MSEESLVSVIIPVYNISPYIKECLNSVQKQTYRNIEIIVVDDGSTDDTAKICENIANTDKRITLIKQENCGVVTARGTGIRISNGDYILFVDGDDWIDYDMIEVLVKNMRDVDIVTSGRYREISKGIVIEEYDKLKKGISDIDYILKNMIYDAEHDYFKPLSITIWNKLYKAELVKKVYFSVDSTITFAEDSVFLYKYLLQCKSAMILEKCFYHYRWRENSAVNAKNDYRLIDVNKVYVALKSDFEKSLLANELLFQLEVWIKRITLWALNDSMKLNKVSKMPKFIINTLGLDNKKIILYGAGTMGKDAYNQLSTFGYEILLWVDKNWESYQSQGLNIVSPKEILDTNYDIILIAVNDKIYVEEIKKELKSKGIPENRLMWNKPMSLY